MRLVACVVVLLARVCVGQLCPLVFDGPQSFDWTGVTGQQYTYVNASTSIEFTLDLCQSVRTSTGLNLGDHLNAFTHGFGPLFYQVLSTAVTQDGCPTGKAWTEVNLYCDGFPYKGGCAHATTPGICTAWLEQTAAMCKGHIDLLIPCPSYAPTDPRQGFDVYCSGIAVEDFVVVSNGVVKPDWANPDSPAMLPANSDSALFLLSMNAVDDDAVVQTVTVESSDDSIMTASVDTAFPLPHAISKEPSFMGIDLFCHASNTASLTVTVTLSDGWQPMVIHLQNQCESAAWNPAAIFFFVIFILLLVTCVAGFLFKYQVQHKRGSDAVLGIEYMRHVYYKATSYGSYAQQVDASTAPFAGTASKPIAPTSKAIAPASNATSTAQDTTAGNVTDNL